MSNFYLFIKLILVALSTYLYVNGPMASKPYAVISFMVILALSFLVPVAPNKKMKALVLSLSIIYICAFFEMFPTLLLFVPFICAEMLLVIGVPGLFPHFIIFSGIPLAYLYNQEALFFLSACFASVLFVLSQRNRKHTSLIETNDTLRLQNYRLQQRIEFTEDFKSRISYAAQLEERNRIAQELHDKIGHTLSAGVIQLEAIRLLTGTDPEKASAMLQTIIDTLRSGHQTIRLTLHNLKPPPEQMGINRLKLMLDEFQNENPVKTSLTVEGDISIIKPVAWKVIVENTTEALTNLLKHSDADQVTVSIHVMNKITRLQIKDNGHAPASIKKGLGLSGMEERLMMVNGTLIADNSDGFCLTMLIPTGGDMNDGNQSLIGR